MAETIYALSSGGLPSGVAIIRISGPDCHDVIECICPGFEFGKPIGLSGIFDPEQGNLVDEGLILTFIGPHSFTGEDIVEFHVHGGRAVVDAVLALLEKIDGLRHAEPGEFTYRAFENGKLDLTQVEGLADLIASESEAQRKLAIEAVGGQPRALLEKWLYQLVSMRSLIEAEIDFVDEEDIPGSVSDQVWSQLEIMIGELDRHLASVNAGQIIKNGFRVTLLGKPNAGKSTLLNCLAGRDVAIVTDIPGTTRDLLEVRLNLGGQVIIVTDTAGIHKTDDLIEKEGINRAHQSAKTSDMTIWLHAADDKLSMVGDATAADLLVISKADKVMLIETAKFPVDYDLAISSLNEESIEKLVNRISRAAGQSVSGSEDILFSRQRQREGLLVAYNALKKKKNGVSEPLEVRAENMRIASDSLGKLIGRVDVEDILGRIFSEFCVGK